MIEEILHRPHIRCNGVLCQICLGKIVFEFCYHIALIYNEYDSNIVERIGHYENLPWSWCLADIKSIFTINPKNKVADDVIAGFVPMTNIADGYSNEFRFEPRLWGHIKKGFTHFAEGDIVVAKISPCLENRKSAIVTSLPNGIGAGTTELFVFRSQCVLPEYGLYFFKSDSFINHCAGSFNGVVGQQRVSKSIIESIKFPLPPLSEQKRIVDAVHTAFTKLDTIMESL